MNVDARRLLDALRANRHFVAIVGAVAFVALLTPGTPGRSLLDGVLGGEPAHAVEAASSASDAAAPPAAASSSIASVLGTLVDRGAIADGAGLALPIGDVDGLPPAAPEAPLPACSTDAAADAYDQVATTLGGALGEQLPSRSIRKLAAIGAGCSDDDPTGAVLDIALDVAALVPDTGLPQQDLPRLPSLPPLPSLPDQVRDALAPIAGPVRDGCANLATIALVLAVLPAAASLPVSGSDLAQLIAPASAVCGLFDEGA